MLVLVARWWPGRAGVVTAESRLAALALLEAVRAQGALGTRLRWEAAVSEPAPARRAQQTGRPRKTGRRWPTLHQVATATAPPWPRVTVSGW